MSYDNIGEINFPFFSQTNLNNLLHTNKQWVNTEDHHNIKLILEIYVPGLSPSPHPRSLPSLVLCWDSGGEEALVSDLLL